MFIIVLIVLYLYAVYWSSLDLWCRPRVESQSYGDGVNQTLSRGPLVFTFNMAPWGNTTCTTNIHPVHDDLKLGGQQIVLFQVTKLRFHWPCSLHQWLAVENKYIPLNFQFTHFCFSGYYCNFISLIDDIRTVHCDTWFTALSSCSTSC